MNDNLYSRVAEELERKEIDKALWAKALSNSGGDKDKSESLYIKYRVKELKKEKRRESVSGLGGWLILPMLGLFITIAANLYSLGADYYPIFDDGYWAALTTPGNEYYHSLWGPVLIYEIVGNIVFALAAVVLLVLFFQEHHKFPKYMIIFMVANVVFLGIDYFASGMIPAIAETPDADSQKELSRAVLSTVIWSLYFQRSVRVRNTFIKKVGA